MLHRQDRCVHNVLFSLGHFTNTLVSFSDPIITFLTSTPIQTHTQTQTHTNRNTQTHHISSRSFCHQTVRLPCSPSILVSNHTEVIHYPLFSNIFKKKCNEARRGMSSSFLRRLQKATKEHL